MQKQTRTRLIYAASALIVVIGIVVVWANDTSEMSSKQQIPMEKELNLELTGKAESVPITDGVKSIAFNWLGEGAIEYSWNDQNYQPIPLMELGKDDFETDRKYSVLLSDLQADAIFIKAKGVKDVKLVQLTDERKSVLGVTSEQTNLSSGASYSKLDIITRKEWGADESRFAWEPAYEKVDQFIIHHTAWDGDDYPLLMRQMYKYHASVLGWGDIGYNYVIDPQGNIYEARKGGDGVIGAHAYGSNGGSVGISLIGDFTDKEPTPAALDALEDLMTEKALLHGVELNWQNTVFGHRDMKNNNTACPGETFYGMLPDIIPNIETVRQNNVDGEINTQRLATADALAGYEDVRLKLTLDAGATNDITDYVPAYSGIVYRKKLSATEMVIGMESTYDYYNTGYVDTPARVRLLHTIFSLDSNFTDVSLLQVPDVLYFDKPKVGSDYDYAEELTARVKFTEPMSKGSGQLVIKDLTADEVYSQIDVTSSAVSISSDGRLLMFDLGIIESGGRYSIRICDTCFQDAAGNVFPGILDDSWVFDTKIKKIYLNQVLKINTHQNSHITTGRARERLLKELKLDTYMQDPTNTVYPATKYACKSGRIPVTSFWNDEASKPMYALAAAELTTMQEDDALPSGWKLVGRLRCQYPEQVHDRDDNGKYPIFAKDIFYFFITQ